MVLGSAIKVVAMMYDSTCLGCRPSGGRPVPGVTVSLAKFRETIETDGHGAFAYRPGNARHAGPPACREAPGQVRRSLLGLPLIGPLAQQRSQQLMEERLDKIVDKKAQICIVDVTAVPLVDTLAASALVRIAHAVKLLGAEVVLTGIRPAVAQALVGPDVDIGSIVTRRDLQAGIAFAMSPK